MAIIEPGSRFYALFWLPIAILMLVITIYFFPYLVAAFPSDLQYLAYLVLASVIFFAIYVFYKKWKGEV
jgi:uncharacterized membrane protein